jgi:hypothetical protein
VVSLKEQVAVVTGGGRGIGRAIALSLADAGKRVVPPKSNVRSSILCAFEGWEQSNPTQLWPPFEPKRSAHESNSTRTLLRCSSFKNFLHFFSTAHPTCRILSSAN